MNRQQYLLTCVSEECHEVGQRAIKQARFGDQQCQPKKGDGPEYPPNHARTLEEFLQLVAVMEMAGFNVRAILGSYEAGLAINLKKQRVEETILESAGYGLLHE